MNAVESSCCFPLALLQLLQGLHCSVESVSVVSAELGIGTLEGWVSRGLWLLDTVTMGFFALVSLRAILRFRHLEESEVQVWYWRWGISRSLAS